MSPKQIPVSVVIDKYITLVILTNILQKTSTKVLSKKKEKERKDKYQMILAVIYS